MDYTHDAYGHLFVAALGLAVLVSLVPFILNPHYEGWPLWLHRFLCDLHKIHRANWRDR
jgi:hypothetical protein